MQTRSTLAASLFAHFVPAALAAQAALSGVVREDSSKRAVRGVEIVIQASNKIATTDTGGEFRLTGLAHGTHIVLVRAIGYRPIMLRAYLVTNDTLVVDLRIVKAPVQLAPLEVTASAVPPGLDAFEERRLAGFGKFVDWTTLRRSEHRRTSDLFREIQGVRIKYDRHGRPFLSSTRGDCPMQIYLNGIVIYKPTGGPGAMTPPIIDEWNISNLDGIEVYRGPSETPAIYGGTGGNCGTVLLWTRRK